MRTNKLYDLTQSAYKTGYSTETALMKLNHDILSQMDLGKCTILAALDLSAAFDTIDHTIIIDRLNALMEWVVQHYNGLHHICNREPNVYTLTVRHQMLVIISQVYPRALY